MSDTLPISFPELVAAARADGDGRRYDIPEGWLQGRTAYGGLSAALALDAALARWNDLPPLRSAQIAFVGPLAGEVTAEPVLLRRGRTAAFVQVDVRSEAGLGLRAMFVFMHAQASHVDLPAPRIANVTMGETLEPPRAIGFTRNFEFRATGEERPGFACFSRWARLRERTGIAPAVELMLIGDVLPPAAMPLFKTFGPISSMTWQINLLRDPPETVDGWWRVRAEAEQAQHGSSSQMMAIWNRDGTQIAAATQSVALFV